MAADAPLLEIEHLEHSYGAQPVVRDLSFSLGRGMIGCLLGRSGCGKTTVLRCIAGFEPFHRGTIRIGGRQVSGGPATWVPAERRGVGMVFQDYALFPHLSVRDNIAFGLHAAGRAERDRRTAELAELVNLSRSLDKFPHEISGGQQQRVALARALAPRPDLLLLDEPFSNLDVDLRERLSLEVREIIKASGATAVLVTHDQQEAFAMADEIGIVHLGRIEQWARPYDLYHRPATRFVADFVGQGAFLPARVLNSHRIELELGVLGSDVPAQCAVGCEVCGKGCAADVLLRPDDIVHDDSSATRAEVVGKAFRGAEILYTLRLASGHRVLAMVPSHHDHAIGEKIGIRLDVEHVIAFAPQNAS
jgi:iron(III) transport system ATP-binding protein